MHKIATLLVTYIGDIGYVERLVPNYMKYNRDKIPLYIVIPDSDREAFEKFICDGIELLTEDSITDNLVQDHSIRGIRPGYVNQEIIKLAFWERGLCENYFCMDSDGMFVRDFYVSDFMYDYNTPYTILVEDNELAVEPEYYKKYWAEREKLIRAIQTEVGLADKRMLTCHGFAILSCKVLKSLHDKYLVPNNLTYRDLLSISPYEYSWYNMWLQKDKTIDIQFREHIFKYFHHKNHHLEYLQKGITLDDIARGYLGVVINSNYSRWDGVVSYEDGDTYELSLKEISSLQLRIIVALLRKPRTLLIKLLARVRNSKYIYRLRSLTKRNNK